jgi:hypothetical protein
MQPRSGTQRLSRLVVGMLVLAGGLAGRAQAEDWRYCLSVLGPERKVYMSAPFQTDKSMERLQDDFAAALNRAGLRHGAGQCPRADDEASITVMHSQAVRFNRETGNAVVEFDRWTP